MAEVRLIQVDMTNPGHDDRKMEALARLNQLVSDGWTIAAVTPIVRDMAGAYDSYREDQIVLVYTMLLTDDAEMALKLEAALRKPALGNDDDPDRG